MTWPRLVVVGSLLGQVVATQFDNRMFQRYGWAEYNETEQAFTSAGPDRVLIGAALTLDHQSGDGGGAEELRRAYEIYFRWLNQVHGGVLIQGTYRPVQLAMLDDGANPDGVSDAINYLYGTVGARLYLAPYGEVLAERAAQQLHQLGGLLMVSSASSGSIFANRPRVFGVATPLSNLLVDALNAAADSARNYRPVLAPSIGYITESTDRMRTVCRDGIDAARGRFSTLFNHVSIPPNAGERALDDAITIVTAYGPEVLVCCAGEGAILRMLSKLQDSTYEPRAIVITSGVNPDTTFTGARFGLFTIGGYSLTPTVIAASNDANPKRRLVTHQQDGIWDADEFSREFKFRHDVDLVSYEARLAMMACATLVYAIEAANSSEPELVKQALLSMTGADLGMGIGPIEFNSDGQIRNNGMTLQNLDTDTWWIPHVVSPGLIETRPLRYPKPGFSILNCLGPTNHTANTTVWGFKAGTRSRGSNWPTCVMCPDGEVAVHDVATNERHCTSCPPGTYMILRDTLQAHGVERQVLCVPCSLGQYSERSGSTFCRPCTLGRYQDSIGSTACASCLPGRSAAAMGASACDVCSPLKDGWSTPTYSDLPESTGCRQCPSGGYCEADPATGMYLSLTNDDNYWRADDNATLFYRCPHGNGEACERDGRCYVDSAGDVTMEAELCGRCKPGHARAALDGLCGRCPNLFLSVLYAMAYVCLALFVTSGALFVVLRTDFRKPKNHAPMVAKQVLAYFQLTAYTMPLISLRFPASDLTMRQIFRHLDFTEPPKDSVFGANCLLMELFPQYEAYQAQSVTAALWIPLWLLSWTAMFLLFRCFRRIVGKKPPRMERLVTILAVHIFVLQPRAAVMSLDIITCKRFDRLRLLADTSVVCMSEEHLPWLVLGTCTALFFTLGVPLVIFMFLSYFHRSHLLDDGRVERTFGFLYAGFEPRCYYFECVFMVRKVIFPIIILFQRIASNTWENASGAQGDRLEENLHLAQLVVLLAVAVVFVGMHMWFQPYDNRAYYTLDRCEMRFLWAILMTLLAQIYVTLTEADRNAEGVFCIVAFVMHILFWKEAVWGIVRKPVTSAWLWAIGREHQMHHVTVQWYGFELKGLENDLLESSFCDFMAEIVEMELSASRDDNSVKSRGHLYLRDLALALLHVAVEARFQKLKDRLDRWDRQGILWRRVSAVIDRPCVPRCIKNSLVRTQRTLQNNIALTEEQRHQLDEKLEEYRQFTYENVRETIGKNFFIEDLCEAAMTLRVQGSSNKRKEKELERVFAKVFAEIKSRAPPQDRGSSEGVSPSRSSGVSVSSFPSISGRISGSPKILRSATSQMADLVQNISGSAASEPAEDVFGYDLVKIASMSPPSELQERKWVQYKYPLDYDGIDLEAFKAALMDRMVKAFISTRRTEVEIDEGDGGHIVVKVIGPMGSITELQELQPDDLAVMGAVPIFMGIGPVLRDKNDIDDSEKRDSVEDVDQDKDVADDAKKDGVGDDEKKNEDKQKKQDKKAKKQKKKDKPPKERWLRVRVINAKICRIDSTLDEKDDDTDASDTEEDEKMRQQESEKVQAQAQGAAAFFVTCTIRGTHQKFQTKVNNISNDNLEEKIWNVTWHKHDHHEGILRNYHQDDVVDFALWKRSIHDKAGHRLCAKFEVSDPELFNGHFICLQAPSTYGLTSGGGDDTLEVKINEQDPEAMEAFEINSSSRRGPVLKTGMEVDNEISADIERCRGRINRRVAVI